MAKYCYKCGNALRGGSKFCHQCGARVRAPSSQSSTQSALNLDSVATTNRKPSLVDRLRKKIDETRTDTVRRIDGYLDSLERREEISGIKLTEGRKNFIRNRLTVMRERLAKGEDITAQKEWQVLSAALESLPEDLVDEKCVVCMKPVAEDPERPLSFCPYCLRGGHQDHIAEWIKMKGICPICRHSLTKSELVTYKAGDVQNQKRE